MKSIKNLISLGYLLMALLVIGIMYIWYKEWCDLEKLEVQNRHIDTFRQESHEIFVLLIELSLSGETVLEWEYADLEHYHYQRMAMDSMLCRFKTIYPTERIDSVRYLLEDKERQMHQIVQVLEQQQAINDKITRQVPVIVQKSVQEQPQKPKRKRFLGIFGKKEKPKPTVTTTMLRSLDRDMIAKQRAQSRRLSEHTDNLVARNAKLNRQLHGFIRQMDKKVQADLQKREAEITAMREQSFMQIGSLTGFVFLLLVISYIIIHRNANRIKRYKQKTTDLIGQLQQSVEQNEALIASRKKAVHTITHELRTPLTAITGYAGLVEKENDIERIGRYICNIRQSSDRMREMLNTLLSFFRLDNGKEQPNISPCRISAITHILETEFTPIAMNKGLALTITNQTDTVVLTDKERILQIGNNLLSNAIKFTENGGVSLTMDYNNGALKLIVEDTGTGMTDEEQQRVFGAFERLSNATAKDGFGLGLSIVQRIVTMLGGTIRLKSEKGKGSHIKVEIPMQTAEELPEQINQIRIHHNHTFHDVIAIDNDEVLLLMLKEMYAQEGVHCDICTDVAELMELIRKKEYVLLLTDLNMPDINGFELLELLRTSNVGNSKTIPVVVTTASGSCSKEELMERGFSGCLLKPFSISELMEVSDKCAMKGNRNEKPDFTSLLSYGNEAVMLEKLITETEKEMQAVRDAEQRKDLQELNALTHHLRSSWEILRADQPLRELYKLLHSKGTSNNEAIHNAVKAVWIRVRKSSGWQKKKGENTKMDKTKIIVVEDNIVYCEFVCNLLARKGFRTVQAFHLSTAKKYLQQAADGDIVVSDLRLPDGNGIDLLRWMRKEGRMQPFIIMTDYAEVHTAVESMKLGSLDYIPKQLVEDKLVPLLRTILKERNIGRSRMPLFSRDGSAFQAIMKRIRLVAPTDMSVLIFGENGTGKEHIAHLLHDKGKRAGKPFVAVDCGSLTKELAPSAFFGHVRGAFTGADSTKKGYFHEAEGGTLFLDEVGNLAPETQQMLLRAIQERRYRPVGDKSDRSFNVRIIAATNEDLEKAVHEKRFRQDLLYRLHDFKITVPPLRDCQEDVMPLAEFFREIANRELECDVIGFDGEARKTLLTHAWPGNVRELRQKIMGAVLQAQTGLVTKEHLELAVTRATSPVSFALRSDAEDKERVLRALKQANGNRKVAAELLGIGRTTLYNKLKEYGLKYKFQQP